MKYSVNETLSIFILKRARASARLCFNTNINNVSASPTVVSGYINSRSQANVQANRFNMFAEHLSVNAATVPVCPPVRTLWYYLVCTRKLETARCQRVAIGRQRDSNDFTLLGASVISFFIRAYLPSWGKNAATPQLFRRRCKPHVCSHSWSTEFVSLYSANQPRAAERCACR